MRESTVSQVRRVLTDRILNGTLAPGTRLREMHIAAELKTSQGPVREALRELEVLGLVHTEPYKGTSVREVSPSDIREAYTVRAVLEGLAGRLAAPALEGKTGHLRDLALAIQTAAQRKDIAGYGKFDMAFHRSIVEAARNKVLLRSWDALRFEIRIQIRLTNSGLNLAEVQKEHWPIIEALDQGASTRAGKLLQQHIFRFAN